ncbi:helix-turn-helix transcriptional regulator [Halodesulfovibrio sp.]|uniref:helix-turn-helix domain-containing protein n=1 Tax=Halodesulfovibrio sp. TaxID=1912772 RepID=UPI0025B947E6|nr:helix-turn-helix transcriptional regulator [Halodesulfovibrio sp.]
MKFSFPREWCIEMAREENGYPVSAGTLDSISTKNDASMSCAVEDVDNMRVAFGRFIQMIRRKRGYSHEQLADNADVDVVELKNIEKSSSCFPAPRTVYQLAKIFNLDSKKLLQLAGLTKKRDVEIENGALAFAANSESIGSLTPEEVEILETFVAVLAEKR